MKWEDTSLKTTTKFAQIVPVPLLLLVQWRNHAKLHRILYPKIKFSLLQHAVSDWRPFWLKAKVDKCIARFVMALEILSMNLLSWSILRMQESMASHIFLFVSPWNGQVAYQSFQGKLLESQLPVHFIRLVWTRHKANLLENFFANLQSAFYRVHVWEDQTGQAIFSTSLKFGR